MGSNVLFKDSALSAIQDSQDAPAGTRPFDNPLQASGAPIVPDSSRRFSVSAEREPSLFIVVRPRDVEAPTKAIFDFVREGVSAFIRFMDDLIRFVRKDLLPQDRVAVFCYTRDTDFTTDHERVVQVLDRYKKVNEKLESLLESHFSGLAAISETKKLPKSFQAEIDAIFAGPEAPSSRQVPPAGPGGRPEQVKVDPVIDATGIDSKMVNERHTARLRIALFILEGEDKLLSEVWKIMDLRLQEDMYQLVMKSGIPFSTLLPLIRSNQRLKVIVYDPGTDRVGSRLVTRIR